MRQDRISKMYEGLSNKELAILSFQYMTDMNELESERVAGAVPVKSYICRDVEYRRWLDGLFNMSAQFAIEHWRTNYRNLASTMSLRFAFEANDIDKVISMLEVHSICETRLLALDHALEAVCNEHGIDANSVRRLAGVEPFAPMCANLKPNQEYQAEMQINLARLLG